MNCILFSVTYFGNNEMVMPAPNGQKGIEKITS